MSGGDIFLLDSNVFMQAARQYYAFDFAPGFWEALVEHASQGRVLSIDKVKIELEKGNDVLADWAKGDFARAFVTTARDDVVAQYGEVMRGVASQAQYTDSAKTDFADGADGWLVAYAKVEKKTIVVTQEPLRPDIKWRIPIPNVCKNCGVLWIDTFEMIRRLQIKLK